MVIVGVVFSLPVFVEAAGTRNSFSFRLAWGLLLLAGPVSVRSEDREVEPDAEPATDLDRFFFFGVESGVSVPSSIS